MELRYKVILLIQTDCFASLAMTVPSCHYEERSDEVIFSIQTVFTFGEIASLRSQ